MPFIIWGLSSLNISFAFLRNAKRVTQSFLPSFLSPPPTVLFKYRWSSPLSACCSAATRRLDGPWAWSELSDHSGCMLIQRTDSARHVPSLLTQQLRLTCVAVRCRVSPAVVASCSSQWWSIYETVSWLLWWFQMLLQQTKKLNPQLKGLPNSTFFSSLLSKLWLGFLLQAEWGAPSNLQITI